MAIEWHPKRKLDWCLSEDEKKQKYNHFWFMKSSIKVGKNWQKAIKVGGRW